MKHDLPNRSSLDRSNSKPRNFLSNIKNTGVFIVSCCGMWCCICLVANQNTLAQTDNMPTVEEFQSMMNEVWLPIKDQYVPYGLALLAVGTLIRKI